MIQHALAILRRASALYRVLSFNHERCSLEFGRLSVNPDNNFTDSPVVSIIEYRTNETLVMIKIQYVGYTEFQECPRGSCLRGIEGKAEFDRYQVDFPVQSSKYF